MDREILDLDEGKVGKEKVMLMVTEMNDDDE